MPEYAVGAPLFSRITVRPASGPAFVIEADKDGGLPYINGRKLLRPFVEHGDLTLGVGD